MAWAICAYAILHIDFMHGAADNIIILMQQDGSP